MPSTMTKSAPVQTLLDLSKMKLDEATRVLGNLISGEQAAEERLELLKGYRTEYHVKFMAAAKNGIDRDAWRNYQAFLDRLDSTITQAEEMVKQSHLRTTAGQREWMGKQERMRAFDTLAQRHQMRQQYAEQHTEQKSQDELAAQKREDKDEL